MADEKKPKIDLKARLGKGSAPTPAPSAVSPGSGVPAPRRSAPAPVMPGVPVGPPPPFGSQPPPIDPGNPLSAVAAPYRAPAPPPAQHHRIEVDEHAVQMASKRARKQGVVIGVVIAVVLGVLGYVAGGAAEQSAGREQSRKGATELSTDVTKARDSLKALADKMEAGGKSLAVDRKFPDALAKDLGGINADFDGTKLAGRRFSGFPSDTTHDLIEFVTSVQSVNDRKAVIIGLLGRLQKPITEQLSTPAGQKNISYVIAVIKDPSGNNSGFLSPLVAPIPVTPQNIALPPKFTFAKPGGGGNTELPPYIGGDLNAKPAAIYVVPSSYEAVCPSATQGQVAQLGAQISSFVHELRGEQGPTQQDVVQDSKPGLIERADKLITELNKI